MKSVALFALTLKLVAFSMFLLFFFSLPVLRYFSLFQFVLFFLPFFPFYSLLTVLVYFSFYFFAFFFLYLEIFLEKKAFVSLY